MLQPPARFHRIQHVTQHDQVYILLIVAAPTGFEIAFLVKRGVEHVGERPRLRQRLPARLAIGEIGGDVFNAGKLLRQGAARQPNNLPTGHHRKMPQRRRAHKTGGARDQQAA